MNRRLFASLVLLLGVIGICVYWQQSTALEHESLEGCWAVTSLTKDGDSDHMGEGYVISFGSGAFQATIFSQHGSVGFYSVDADRDPKWIDMWVTGDEGEEPQYFRGIYTASKRSAKICITSAGTRPATFEARKDDGNTLLILELTGDAGEFVPDSHGVGVPDRASQPR
jgi:uncharacterized protein (TIGR03067 family)